MEKARKPEGIFIRLASDVVRDGHVESYADLCDEIRWRCARAHIRYTEDDVTAAAHFIADARGLFKPKPQRPVLPEDVPQPHGPSRSEAAAILARLRAAPKPVPVEKDSEMRTWTRTVRPINCGSCKEPIPVGTLALMLHQDGWTKFRCLACARLVAPDDVPPDDLPEASTTTTTEDRDARIEAVRQDAHRRLSALKDSEDA